MQTVQMNDVQGILAPTSHELRSATTGEACITPMHLPQLYAA